MMYNTNPYFFDPSLDLIHVIKYAALRTHHYHPYFSVADNMCIPSSVYRTISV